MNRQQRLKDVLEFIKSNGDSEYNFDKLYNKLQEEYRIELEYNSDMHTNLYLNNLRQTIQKQANTYIETKRKRPKGDCKTEFKDFVLNFKQDLSEAIQH